MTADTTAIFRILDANANRATEGLRVVEEFVRFVLDDKHLTGLCKNARHDLVAILQRLPSNARLAARETQFDVGTQIETAAEFQRTDARSVAVASMKRVEQSVRCLEEYGKVVEPQVAASIEQLRYRLYTLHRAIEITDESLQRLAPTRLYVLIDGAASSDEFQRRATELITAGVHLLQLRDKRLDDRQLLARARQLRQLTSQTATLFIVNDRPDIAALSQADGVHLGQDELSVKDARTIVGPERLIGVSTHSIEQARQAVLDGANYIGCGPTFPSGTKSFDHFPGLPFLQQVTEEIRLPAFAIGGIHADNVSQVLATGFTRIAVSGAIGNASSPSDAVQDLLSRLNL